MLAIPTTRVLRSVSGADEELGAEVLLGCEILQTQKDKSKVIFSEKCHETMMQLHIY